MVGFGLPIHFHLHLNQYIIFHTYSNYSIVIPLSPFVFLINTVKKPNLIIRKWI